MIGVNIMWPNSDGAKFNLDYYLNKHIPMLASLLGDSLRSVEVDQGIGGREPGSAPPYLAITRLQFDSIEDFQLAFGPHAEKITGDEPNFTNVQVRVQLSQVVM